MALIDSESRRLIATLDFSSISDISIVDKDFTDLVLSSIPIFFIDFADSVFGVQSTEVSKSFIVNTSQDTTITKNIFKPGTPQANLNIANKRTLLLSPSTIDLNITVRYNENNLLMQAFDTLLTLASSSIENVLFHYISDLTVSLGMHLTSFSSNITNESNMKTATLGFSNRTAVSSSPKDTTDVASALDVGDIPT